MIAGVATAALIPVVALPASATKAPPGPPAAIITPDAYITNDQAVSVTWSGYTPTTTQLAGNDHNHFEHEVGVYECVAPSRLPASDAHYYYARDCYTEQPLDGTPRAAGNMIDPLATSSSRQFFGNTSSTGTGERAFQIQAGTLHTDSYGGQPPFNVQCDQADPCVVKVVDMGLFFKSGNTIADPVGHAVSGSGDWSDLVDNATAVPINFAVSPSCPAAVSAQQVSIQGGPSSSAAVGAWSSQLCQGSRPTTLSFAKLGETLAKSNFAAGSTDVALASLPPASGPNGAGYVATPVDVSGVSIGFNMIDPATGTPITTLRLTPRLVAMLVTNSATLTNGSFSASAPYHCKLLPSPGSACPAAPDLPTIQSEEYKYPLTQDPEFVALNPGIQFPEDFGGSYGVLEPILSGNAGDDNLILTQWIADDADARAFLAGADVCRAPLNAHWAGTVYPTDQFLDLEQGTETPIAPADYYNPVTDQLTAIDDLLFGKPAGFNPDDATGVAPAMPAADTSQIALLGALDATSVARSGVPAASLVAASAASTIGTWVTVNPAGSFSACTAKAVTDFSGFAPPDTTGLSDGLSAMAANPDGTLAPPVTTTAKGAYPLTKVDYAFAASTGLTQAMAAAIAAFASYASGPGQASDVLPFGYLPMPSRLQVQAAAAVAKIEAGAVVPPPPTTVTSPSTTTATTTPTTVAPTLAVPASPSSGGFGSGSSPLSPVESLGTGVGAESPVALPVNPVVPPAPAPAPASSARAVAYQVPFTVAAATSGTGGWLLPLLAALSIGCLVAGGGLHAARRRSVGRT